MVTEGGLGGFPLLVKRRLLSPSRRPRQRLRKTALSYSHPSLFRLYSPTSASASAISAFISSTLYTVAPLA